METEWIMVRTHLWQLHREHPEWGAKKLARFSQRSLTWVKKWRRRLRGADPADETVLHAYRAARVPASARPSRCARQSSTGFWPWSRPTGRSGWR